MNLVKAFLFFRIFLVFGNAAFLGSNIASGRYGIALVNLVVVIMIGRDVVNQVMELRP